MNSKVLQLFIKGEYANISSEGFITIKEFNIRDNTTIIPINLPNEFKNWLDIDHYYLSSNSLGFLDIDEKGFLFYTPALMYVILDNSKELINSTALMYWLFKLRDENLKYRLNELLQLFNKKQLFILVIFLELILKYDDSMHDDISDIIVKIEKIILGVNNL